mmetsp:Transcript_31943/g.23087  ORF Transcript_31943/g.23087 Transcript_31943/m.23087 type:complete len:108 (+) Transcript_31943:954-1277(+)
MLRIRKGEVDKAKTAEFFGIILGTLGRQGNINILEELEALFKKHNRKYFVLYLSEILPDKLRKFTKVDAWVQIACPRISIDWGHYYDKPFLNTYEVFTALSEIEWKN